MFDKTDCSTFLKCINKCYQFKDVYIGKNQAMRLYIRLDDIIKDKKKNYINKSKNNLA